MSAHCLAFCAKLNYSAAITYLEISEEKALNEELHFFRDMAEYSPDGMLFFNHTTWEFILYNKSLEEIQGWTMEDLQKNPDLWINMVHEKDKKRVMNICDNFILNKKYIFDLDIYRKDGVLICVSMSVVWRKYNNSVYCIAIVRQNDHIH